MPDALKEYKAKRNFSITSEPAEGGEASKGALTFVIQKHWATRLHYDFRLELDGTMKSWAVPKGPSFDSHDRRMAVHVEDHPISYSDFEGTIPPQQYGAGKVIVWDKGTWEPIGDPRKGYHKGEIKFEIHGHKMHGRWVLVRLRGHEDDKQEPWLLIKENDEYARPASEFSVVDEMPDSVKDLPMPGAPEDREAAQAKVGMLKAEAKPARKAAAKSAAKPAAKTAKATKRGAMPEGAVKAELPETLNAELATLVDGPPERPEEWIFEIKFDGYRMLTRVDRKGRDIRLITRNGNDWTDKLRPLQEEIRRMKLPDGWYDGEIVVHDENGKPNFNLLQLAFDGSNRAQIVYFIFDAPYMKGYDLRNVRLDQRRPLLQEVLDAKPSDTVRFSSEFGTDPGQLVVAACQIGLEGVIGKRRDSRYVTRRSPEWIKLKCGMRQEFVIGGYTDPHGARTGIGSLLLGYYDKDGVLRYAGNCGSGFNGASLRHMRETLEAIATDENPFPPRAVPGRGNHWVKPQLVAEVSFSEWTATNSIRHPVFQGLRKDKPAKSVVREQAKHVQETATVNDDEQTAEAKPAPRKRAGARASKAEPADSGIPGVHPTGMPTAFKVTHGERVMDKQSGVTKLELVEYYALVGELMMAHLKGRPVSLVRAPEGVGGELFFQKHVVDTRKMPGVGQLDQALDPDHPRMTRIDTVEGILSCAQWNVVEIHSQNAVEKRYDTPDRFVFDLDPGEGIEWPAVQEAAQVMRAFLQELGLNPFLKTSGGKGLHVVVPLKPKLDWDTVKDFSHAIVTHLAKTLPDRFSDKSGARNRVGRIFIDYLRNGRGATTVSAWSARVRPGLGISVPVRWEELPELSSGAHWTVRTVGERLAVGNTPWEDYEDGATTLTKAMKALGFKPK